LAHAVEPAPRGGLRVSLRKLQPCHQHLLREVVDRNPAVTLQALQGYLSKPGEAARYLDPREHLPPPVEASLSTVHRHLGLLAFTMKQLEIERASQNSLGNKLARRRWVAVVWEPRILPSLDSPDPRVRASVVFADETNWNLHYHRSRGRALRGHRAKQPVPTSPELIVSLLLAIHWNGVVALMIKDGGITWEDQVSFWLALTDRPWFRELVDRGIRPTLVWDNAPPHHTLLLHDNEHHEGLLDTQGWHVRYLPPYSPELDPVENVFGLIKDRVHSERENVLNRVDLRLAVRRAVQSVTAEECRHTILHVIARGVEKARRMENM
jgi:hypothetical protein